MRLYEPPAKVKHLDETCARTDCPRRMPRRKLRPRAPVQGMAGGRDGPRVVERDTMADEETISWFAGVDWGSERHQVCLLDLNWTRTPKRQRGIGVYR